MYHLFCVGRKDGWDNWPLSMDIVFDYDVTDEKKTWELVYYSVIITKLECVK